MAYFHKIRVKEIREETNDCKSLLLDIPKDLWKEFRYGAGEHIIFRKYFDGEDIRRTYSLCSNPFDKEWRVCVKQIPEGKFSSFVHHELKEGDYIEASAPTGKFAKNIQLDREGARRYVFFAAGSGITPISAMIKMVLQQEPNCHAQLFYTNRDLQNIVFREELEQLRNKYMERFELYHILTRQHRDIDLFDGRIDEEKIDLLVNTLIDVDSIDHLFICGPEEMTFLIRDEMVKHGLAKNKIHYELFVTGLSEEDKKRAAAALESKYDGTQITVIEGGIETNFVMTDAYDNVLDAALAAGANVPFACKDGMCSTCKCKVVEGSVVMKKNYALEKPELEQNFVLSCQSVPTSEKLVVNYDI